MKQRLLHFLLNFLIYTIYVSAYAFDMEFEFYNEGTDSQDCSIRLSEIYCTFLCSSSSFN